MCRVGAVVLTEADDGIESGEPGVADALRDGEAGDGEAGDDVGAELGERVGRQPLEAGERVAERGERARPAGGLARHGAPRLVREERLPEAGADRAEERARRWHRHARREPPGGDRRHDDDDLVAPKHHAGRKYTHVDRASGGRVLASVWISLQVPACLVRGEDDDLGW
jgi:hypothetical protein